MGLRAIVRLVEADAQFALESGDQEEFFSYVYANEGLSKWIDPNPLDLDKAWHVIHFVTTGNTSLTLLDNGMQVPGLEEHLEFHSRFSVAKVQRLNLGKSAEDLLQSVSAAQLNELGLYDRAWNENELPYLREHLSAFLNKLDEAVATSRGMFVSIM